MLNRQVCSIARSALPHRRPAGCDIARAPSAAKLKAGPVAKSAASRLIGAVLKPDLDLDGLATLLRSGERAALARAITLVESTRPDHRLQARLLVSSLLPSTGEAIRIGITGVPGVGKSTLIDQFGSNLTTKGHRVAVLAVDPSSARSGGSILGDKTRMARLSVDRQAFIRPSPASGTLGGVAARTREAMLLCEAAGFDVILVETVGVGQSETTVADLTDVFVVLMLAGAGDELQGLKKGVLELADIVAVNKADGEGLARARVAAAEYQAALHILAPPSARWKVPVLTVSGMANLNLDRFWATILEHRHLGEASGELRHRRRAQQVKWMRALIEERALARLRSDPAIRARLSALEAEVAAERLLPDAAAEEIAAMLQMPQA
ncbi:methylmalonyl-CoA mutase metallochaperone MeaB [Rhizobiales bacterium GAS113]|jgi:LAO/AO transport system kinase|nr:methylmalonyl-CoA mutase metallochaperone MeaB [Rhizobiales bacterium GAS113]SEE10967.1 methylmalonyl-CoA mutase metallochaperone MeaB [Rhizobiales bacterium GAS188]